MNNTIERSKTLIPTKKRSAWREYIPSYVMLSPTIILMLALSIYPILWSIRYCLFEWDGIGIAKFIGFDNFIRAFTNDALWWKSVVNTLMFAGLKLVIEIPFSLILAFMLNSSIKGKSVFRNIYFLPSAISIAVLGIAFSTLLSPYNGYMNNILLKLGIIDSNVNWLGHPTYAFVICVLLSVWQFFGQNTLLFIAGLQGIPNDLYECAKIEGATVSQIFRKITLPMIMPVLQTVLMVAIIGSLNSFDIVFVLTGGGPQRATDLMALNIYNRFFGADSIHEYGYGSALGVLCSAVIGGVTIFYLIVSQRIKEKYQ